MKYNNTYLHRCHEIMRFPKLKGEKSGISPSEMKTFILLWDVTVPTM